MPLRLSQIAPLVALLAMAIAPREAASDVIELKDGGTIRGKLVEPDGPPPGEYRIATPSGGEVVVRRSQLARLVREDPALDEYRERARSAADTVESHARLAEWCRERGLRDEYLKHMARIVQLEPQHEEARLALGYRRVQGAWLNREDLMESRGLVLYNGKHRSRQEIEILERAAKIKKAGAEWSERLGRWHRWLSDRRPERVDEARRSILAVRDPLAAEPLVELLKKEQNFAIKRLLMETAAQIEHQATLNALVELSLSDPNDEVRLQALEYLILSRPPGLTAPYIRALRRGNTETIARAAGALQKIGNPRAMGALVDTLVTDHKRVVGGGSPGQQGYAFSPDGSSFQGGFGGGGPKVIRQKRRNPAVLSALVHLSGGQSFGYDQQAWRAWLEGQAKVIEVNVRRDR